MGWTSPMQPLLTSEHSPIGTEPLTLDDMAWLGSIIYIGSIVGSYFWGISADRLGRKITACLAVIPHLLSWILILVANSKVWLLAARFVSGTGYSASMVVVIVFTSEIAQDDLRGFFGSFLVIFISIGFLYAYIIGTYLKYYGLALCSLIVPVIFLLTFVWLPETPMYLWKSGQIVKARQSLLWYRGGDTIETEKTLLKYKSMKSTHTRKVSLKALVSTRGTTKALIIGMVLSIAMQTCGAFPLLSFAVHIFEMSGTSLTPYQSAIVIAIAQLISSMFCSVLIDRLGRKFLLVGSLMVMTASLTLLGGYLFYFKNESDDSLLNWTPLVSLTCYLFAFAGGLGPVSNVVKAEIFPTEMRGLAVSQFQLLNAIFAFVFIKLFPLMKNTLNLYGCFWFYGSCCLVCALFLTFYLPETKGKPQNLILKILNNEDLNANYTMEEGEQLSERQPTSDTNPTV